MKDETVSQAGPDLEAARRVFRLESEGISALADALDGQSFARGHAVFGYRPGDCFRYGEERPYQRVRSPPPSLRPARHIMFILRKPATAILA